MHGACVLLALSAAWACRAEVALIRDGRPLATVVVPADPSPGHEFAAQELVDHVRLSTGAQLPVVEDGEAASGKGLPIYVGHTRAAARRPSLGETTRTKSPAFGLRMFFVRDDRTALWALRNRINGLFPAEWAEKVDGDLAYLPPGIGRGIHSFADLIPPETCFETHPEYCPLPGGQRRLVGLREGGGEGRSDMPELR